MQGLHIVQLTKIGLTLPSFVYCNSTMATLKVEHVKDEIPSPSVSSSSPSVLSQGIIMDYTDPKQCIPTSELALRAALEPDYVPPSLPRTRSRELRVPGRERPRGPPPSPAVPPLATPPQDIYADMPPLEFDPNAYNKKMYYCYTVAATFNAAQSVEGDKWIPLDNSDDDDHIPLGGAQPRDDID